MAKEYIERNEFREVLRKSHEAHTNNSREASLLDRDIRLLNEQPAADVVEVVRCKDCVFRKKATLVGHPAWWSCGNPTSGMGGGVELKDDDFCSYGKRRGEYD